MVGQFAIRELLQRFVTPLTCHPHSERRRLGFSFDILGFLISMEGVLAQLLGVFWLSLCISFSYASLSAFSPGPPLFFLLSLRGMPRDGSPF